jgi:hypothetical protein
MKEDGLDYVGVYLEFLFGKDKGVAEEGFKLFKSDNWACEQRYKTSGTEDDVGAR